MDSPPRSCNAARSTTGYNRQQPYRTRSLAASTAFLCLLASTASAATIERWKEVLPSQLALPTVAPTLVTEDIALDTRIPVLNGDAWTMESPAENELRRRTVSTNAPATTTVAVTVSVSVASTTSSTSSETLPASPLPSPFDGGLNNNFTAADSVSCPTFINNLLADSTFKTCYPVSLLLQSSTSFFQAEKSLVSITQVLDASCHANATFCSNYLSSMASNLTSSANCQADFQLGNPIVAQAYLAMISYQTVYSATCLKDPVSKQYCFGNAVTNLTNPSSVYFYYLPLNSSLPGGTTPPCGTCLKDTMGVYQIATANRALPIANTYADAATQVNTICGPGFVNATLPNAIVTSSGSSMMQGPNWSLVVVVFVAALMAVWVV